MHPTILVKRKADALQRIVQTADALAQRLELDPVLVDALQPQGIKDPRVIEMKRLEALAGLLDQLAAMAGVTEPVAVTTETAAQYPPSKMRAKCQMPISGSRGLL